MSVLIKGMEMPTSCFTCSYKEYGYGDVSKYYCSLLDACIGTWGERKIATERLADCPLVEVPTPHGRLIDADEIIEVQMFDEMYEEWTLKTMSVAEYLAFAADMPPTIIEAEEEKRE